MAYQYKNGMRYLVTEEDKNNTAGYHFHSDISAKIGTEDARVLKLHVDTKISAGTYVPLKVKLKKLQSVKLNGYSLTPKLDYILKDNTTIAFTFNLSTSDKVEIKGFVDVV